MIDVRKIKKFIENEEESPTLDYKEDLVLKTEGDKAKFVKDMLSLANSGGTAHIITGVQDSTRKLLGIKTYYKVEQLNQTLKDKCDPPLSIEYVEKEIMGHTIGAIEIVGENPPYIVAVPDRYGGPISSDPQKSFYIERGTIFVRNYNMNAGARRADLDKMYKIKYTTLQADLQLSHEVSIKQLDKFQEVEVSFSLVNLGEISASDVNINLRFLNIEKIVNCKGGWRDISSLNNNVPTVSIFLTVPATPFMSGTCSSIIIEVKENIKQIESELSLSASNMRLKRGPYSIPLKEN